jgi:arsenate reductase-like glutaredoxin family protein
MEDMGVISTDSKKITLYYNSESSIGKQCYAYVQSSDKEVLGIDISKTNVSGTQWGELAGNLNIDVKELIDVEHPDFKKEYGDDKVDLEPHHWMKILEKKPELVQYPILVFGEKYYQLKSGAEFKKYLEANSKGITNEKYLSGE